MKLKPCPFCGGEATLWSGNIDDDYSDLYYDVYCTACNCMTPKFHDEESAIRFWNRREPMDKIVEQLEGEEYDVNCNICDYDSEIDTNTLEYYEGKEEGIREAIEIVKGTSNETD